MSKTEKGHGNGVIVFS